MSLATFRRNAVQIPLSPIVQLIHAADNVMDAKHKLLAAHLEGNSTGRRESYEELRRLSDELFSLRLAALQTGYCQTGFPGPEVEHRINALLEACQAVYRWEILDLDIPGATPDCGSAMIDAAYSAFNKAAEPFWPAREAVFQLALAVKQTAPTNAPEGPRDPGEEGMTIGQFEAALKAGRKTSDFKHVPGVVTLCNLAMAWFRSDLTPEVFEKLKFEAALQLAKFMDGIDERGIENVTIFDMATALRTLKDRFTDRCDTSLEGIEEARRIVRADTWLASQSENAAAERQATVDQAASSSMNDGKFSVSEYLEADDVKILRALDEATTLITQYDLEAATTLSRKTIGARLDGLREAGLTFRPKGSRRGEAITEAGRECLRKLERK